jgi:two-component system, LuxR family, sensor kinase FixL
MSLNWVLIVWSMAASASLMLAGIHFLVWCKDRSAWANLSFSLMASAVVALASCELWMMGAATPAEFGTALRWLHVAGWATVLSMVGFARLYLRAGRPWLAWTYCAVRTLALLPNFLSGQNINFRQITALGHVPFLGESVGVAIDVKSPWMLVNQLGLLLLVVFIADAAYSVWRRGERRLALVMGGSILLCILGATVQSVLVLWGIVSEPLTPSLFFVFAIVAMSYQMSLEVLRAAQLAAKLEKSEGALRLSEWRYEQAAEAAGVGTWEWDLLEDEIWTTDRGRALLGFAPGERIDVASVAALLRPEDREALRAAFAHARDARGTYQRECQVKLPGGGTRWIATRCHIDSDTSGEAVMVRGVSFDVSERVRTRQEIARQRHELAHLSRVSMLNVLSVSMGHELSQPLQAILTNAQVAQRLLGNENPNLEQIREVLRGVVQDGERGSEVIRGLRALLKKGEARFESLDVNELVRDGLRLVNGELRLAGVALATTLASDLPPIKGNRVQLQQVLLNLIINGCEAMAAVAPKNRRLLVSTELNEDAAVLIGVTDGGPGIPPQHLESVFDAFFSTKTNGLGVGLSVSRSIIASHGGHLWAASHPGSGARFCFTVPSVLPRFQATRTGKYAQKGMPSYPFQ